MRLTQQKRRDRGLKCATVSFQHFITPLHSAEFRFDDSAACIMKGLARLYFRLLPHHTFADDLLDFIVIVLSLIHI